MNWTEEQSQAIELRGKSMLVSAAAGSGKTAVLVERIKRLIQEDGLSPEELLVVTFTNAAASEMREKIVSQIPEQMNQIHKAQISTFHAFALDVIRRYFHLINLEPGFRICDDAQRVLLQSDSMDDLFECRFQKRDKDFLHFLNLYAVSRNEEAVKSMILQVHSFLQSLPQPFPWLEEKIETLGLGEQSFRESSPFREMTVNIMEELDYALADIRTVWEKLAQYGLEKLEEKARKDLTMVERIRDSFPEDFDKGAALLSSMVFQRFAPSAEEKPLYGDIRESVTLFRDRAKDSLKKLSSRYFSKPLSSYVSEMNATYPWAGILKEMILEFDSIYKRKKREKGLIDFSDIEHFALEILSDETAASEYRNKFRYIFIDEYQDSNLVQEAIIRKIQREDNVFMVGDVKQSIYKFRLAEPEIFLNKYKQFKEGTDPFSTKLDLNRNFRSKEPIIRTVNHVFSRIMDQRSTGISYDEAAALYKGVSYKGPLDHNTEFHLVEDRHPEDEALDEEVAEMKRTELEAWVAAALIKENRGLPYYDEKTKKQRHLCNRDMVILLRSASGTADIYREALEREGIPAYVDTGDGYFDTLEIAVFLNLLKIIDNKRQDVPFLSVLRSPIFDFSVDQLARIRVEKKGGSYFEAFQEYSREGSREDIKERCLRTFSLLNHWKRQATFLPLSDFIWSLIRETGYYTYVGALPGGTQRQANLRALADKGAAYETGSGKGLFGFIHYIEAIRKGKVASAPIKLLGENDDVVRIMTVHKSKGLEFPLVLVGGLGKDFHREKGSSVSRHKDLGVAMRQVDKELCCFRKTLLQSIIETRLEKEGMAEELRILYVALTRPMDKLILLGTVKDASRTEERMGENRIRNPLKARNYLDFLLPVLRDCNDINFYTHNRGRVSIEKKEKKGTHRTLLESIERGFSTEQPAYHRVAARLNWAYGYDGALQSKSKYSVSELSRQGIKPEGWNLRAASDAASGSKGAERGVVYHSIMERIPLKADAHMTYAGITAFTERLIDMDILTEEQVRSVDLMKIVGFFQSPLGRRLTRAGKVFREEAFNLLKEKEGEEILVQGIIDCYFMEGEKCILVDFKSDFVTDTQEDVNALAERYRPQLSLYKEALEQIRGLNVDEMYLYLFSIDKEVRL